jgi:hypothetical protein
MQKTKKKASSFYCIRMAIKELWCLYGITNKERHSQIGAINVTDNT